MFSQSMTQPRSQWLRLKKYVYYTELENDIPRHSILYKARLLGERSTQRETAAYQERQSYTFAGYYIQSENTITMRNILCLTKKCGLEKSNDPHQHVQFKERDVGEPKQRRGCRTCIDSEDTGVWTTQFSRLRPRRLRDTCVRIPQ